MQKNESSQIEKVLIIGSGPAGLTAGLYTARALLNPLLIEGEEAGGQLMLTTEVENFPGFEHGIQGPDLMSVMRKQAARFDARFITQNVTKVDFSKRPFKVWVGNQMYQSNSVIVSTGARSKYLGLPAEKTYMGRGVSTCATCDGAFYRNMEVAIVGGGDSAMEEANFLTRFASKVYIIHRRDHFRASKIMADRALNNPKIKVLWNSAVEDILGQKTVEKLVIKNLTNNQTSELAVAGVFIAIGHMPNTELFAGQLDLDENGYILTEKGRSFTNVEGVFACGDVQDHIYRQAITAAGSGCQAAIDCERWLETQGV